MSSLPEAESSASILCTVEMMMRQEESAYCKYDYLQTQLPQMDANLPLNTAIDADCRFRMVEWCFQVIDHLKFRRDTVTVAISCLDRFLCSPAGTAAFHDRVLFQLVAMTCLYTSVKVHEPQAMDPELVASLSRGAFNKEQIEKTEAALLKALQWRVHPPTPLAFAHLFLNLVPDEIVTKESRTLITDLCKLQSEASVSKSEFIPVKASIVALGALMNAFESLNMDLRLQAHIISVIAKATQINHTTHLFRQVRIHLYEAISKTQNNSKAHSMLKSVNNSEQSAAHSQEQHKALHQQQQHHCATTTTSSHQHHNPVATATHKLLSPSTHRRKKRGGKSSKSYSARNSPRSVFDQFLQQQQQQRTNNRPI